MLGAYLLDGKRLEWTQIIEKAKSLDASFGQDGMCTTFGAAVLLREHGHTVEDAPLEAAEAIYDRLRNWAKISTGQPPLAEKENHGP